MKSGSDCLSMATVLVLAASCNSVTERHSGEAAAFSAGQGRDSTEICHFQPDQGRWKRLSVGTAAGAAHLGNHDDAVPGGTTSQTGTALDDRCQPGAACTAAGCDDGNPCTADACDAGGQCTHAAVADGTFCRDADHCNGAERCQAGACVAGPPPVCDDGDPCTADSCDPALGCGHLVDVACQQAEFRCSCDDQLTVAECLHVSNCTPPERLAGFCQEVCDGRFGPGTTASSSCGTAATCASSGVGTNFVNCNCFQPGTWNVVAIGRRSCATSCPLTVDDLAAACPDCPAGTVAAASCLSTYPGCIQLP